MSWHDEETAGSIHVIHQFEYADAAARTGATGLLPADIGKAARQLDDDSFWVLQDDSPVTWGQLTPASSGVPAHASTHENGGADEISVAGLSGVLADAQTPSAHASSHQNGGADEISVAGLSGALADPQTPTTHSTSHENGGADEISVAGLSGALADPQTPTTHAASHQNGGADEVATATPTANAIPKADAASKLDTWISDATEAVKGKAELATQAETNAGTDDQRIVTPLKLATTLLALIREVDKTASEGTSSITGTTAFQTKIASWTPSGAPFTGNYRLKVECEFNHDTGGGDTEVRVMRTDVGPTEQAYAEAQPGDGDDWFHLSTTIPYDGLSGVSISFALEYRTGQAGQTATIRRARFFWEQVL
jgi:hypothetical protein